MDAANFSGIICMFRLRKIRSYKVAGDKQTTNRCKERYMLTIEQKMIEENNLCVLATCSNNLPNSSLMHYIYDDNDKNIFMLALRGSVKHKNIEANPHVSLLIDTRTNVQMRKVQVMALTIYGKAGFVEDPQKQQAIVDQLVAKHKSLANLASDSQCLVIQVHMEKMMLLDGVSGKSTTNI